MSSCPLKQPSSCCNIGAELCRVPTAGTDAAAAATAAAGAAADGKTIPTAILNRIMRQALPPRAKVAGDAKESMDRCVAEFAAVVMSTAVQVAREERRVTVTGEDVVAAMGSLGFDDYVGPLAAYLRRYRELRGAPAPRGRRAAEPVATVPAPAPAAATTVAPPPPPPSVGLTLVRAVHQPPPCDVTELGLHADVYAVWRGDAAAPGPSQMPPPAVDDE
ncbi:hypothetical protein ACP4OV_001297 [Aristida adscensionis]